MPTDPLVILSTLAAVALACYLLIWRSNAPGYGWAVGSVAALLLGNAIAVAAIHIRTVNEYGQTVMLGTVPVILMVAIPRRGKNRVWIGVLALLGIVAARLIYHWTVGGRLPTDL